MKRKRAKPTHAPARVPKPVPGTDARRVLGRARGDQALFPVPPPAASLPPEYATTLREIKNRVSKTRISAVLAANAAMVTLCWDVGQIILARQGEEGWFWRRSMMTASTSPSVANASVAFGPQMSTSPSPPPALEEEPDHERGRITTKERSPRLYTSTVRPARLTRSNHGCFALAGSASASSGTMRSTST